MEYRNLGRTGVKVSVLCVGCMNFGGPTTEADSIDIIHKAMDDGINFFDTANVYSRGISETITGKALKGRRDKVVLATKVHGRMDDDNILAAGNSRRHIIEQCDASLKRLQTDYIDLYQIHRPQSDIPIDETLRAMDDLIRSGKVRYVGTSSYTAWQVLESLWVAKELGLNRFVSEQPPYNLMDRSIERELLPMARTYGIAVIPWSPLARGFLAGKYRRGEDLPEGSRFARDMTNSNLSKRGEQHFTDRAFEILDTVEAIAQEKEATASQIALAWMIAQEGITSPIIGPRTMGHLEDNLAAVGIEITADDCARLDSVAPPEEATASYYNGRAMDFKPPIYRW